MKKLMVVAVLAVVLCVGVGGVSQGYADGFKKSRKGGESLEQKIMGKAHFIMMNQDELGITDETLQSLKELKVAAKKEIVVRNAEIELVEIDIKSKMSEDIIVVSAIQELIDKKYELKKNKAKYLIEVYAKLKTLLTQEQVKTMKMIWKKEMKEKKEFPRRCPKR